ncbi:MAG: Ig-like domain-containing protein [Piscinibacter sp.]|uniref:Ig-like domain-containing protein n=1 Tax=Piscinibacter sp. TaxID=1903157 RepID=UPI003D0B6F91
MKLVKAIWILAAAALLNACGGGSDAGSSPFNPGSGGGGGGTTTVADIVLNLSATQVANTGSATVTVTATALDATRNALADVPLTIAADADAVITASDTETDASGKLGAVLSIGSNRSNRLITVTAVSGSISRTANVQVFGADISGVLAPAVLLPSESGTVQYRVVDQAGNAMANQEVTVTAAGLTPSQAIGRTGSNGEFVFNYAAPATAGSYQITASSAGDSDTQTVQVQSTSTVPNVTTAIASASVSAEPSVVAVNTVGGTSNRAEIRALFLAANNVPIPNVRVTFDLGGDPQNVGGSFTAGGNGQILYTDANGAVTTAYVPGTRSSPTDGVIVRACYGTSDTDPNLLNCTTSASKTLTVTSEPLSVTIGTNANIVVETLTYTKQFIVTVVDSSGAAKQDVNIVAAVDLLTYRKGQWVVGGTAWAKAGALPSGDSAICQNEDANRNGVLEASEDSTANGNGNGNGTLEPRKADVSVRLLSPRTDARGSVVLEVTYPQDRGSWIDALITVTASGIAGTEGRATYLLDPLPVEAAAVRNTSNPPAFVVSPYGTSTDCTNPN